MTKLKLIPNLVVSVARYLPDHPLWSVLLYWSDEPRIDLRERTFGSEAAAMRYARKQTKLAEFYRAPVQLYLCGKELVR